MGNPHMFQEGNHDFQFIEPHLVQDLESTVLTPSQVFPQSALDIT